MLLLFNKSSRESDMENLSAVFEGGNPIKMLIEWLYGKNPFFA